MTTPVRRVPRLLAIVLTGALAISGAVSATALPASAATVFEVTGTLSGKPTSTTDAEPLAGMAVYGAAVDDNGNPDYGDSTVTDENGVFTIAFEAAGDYTLQFNCSSGDQAYCDFAYPREYLGHSSDAKHATTFTLTDSAPALVQDFTLEGVSQISGTIVDEAGEPASGAYVYANHPGQTGGDSTTTDENGEFTLSRVAAGTIVVSSDYYPTASAENRRFYFETYYPATVHPTAATALAIASGSETEDIDIAVALQPSVRLHAVDENGDPVSGVYFSRFTLNEQTGEFERPQSGESLGTNADGWYARSESPGTYKYFIADYRYPSVDDFSMPQTRVENYGSEWFDNSQSQAGAAVVTVTDTSIDQRVLEVVLAEHTGAPGLVGDLEIGADESDPATLTTVGFFDFTPGTTQFTRQWLRDGTPVDGATGPSYSLTVADAGTEITLQLTATLGSTENSAVFTSSPFDVSGLPFDDAPAPTIGGEAVVGNLLTADPKTWSPAPSSRTYQWLRDGEIVAGATGLTYQLGADDIGSAITFRTTGRLAGYTRTTLVSAPTGTVLDVFVAPTSISAPTGETTVGHTLTAVTGSWSPQPDSYRYQWVRKDVATGEGSPIAGATDETYVLTTADAGKVIAVEIVAEKDGFAAPAAVTSQATNPVLDVFAVPATIAAPSGAATVGKTLTAQNGTWSPDPSGYNYQWVREDTAGGAATPIAGANSPFYTLTAADAGKYIAVSIVAVKDGFAPPAAIISEATTVVLDIFDPPKTIPAPSGEAVVGTTLTANTGVWAPEPSSFTYQWLRRDASGATVAIPGATGATYTLVAADVGKSIAVEIGAARDGFADSSTVRSASTTVVLDVFVAPGTIPVPTGTTHKGQTLTAVTGSWNPNADSYLYQWVRKNSADTAEFALIGSANGSTYQLGAADVGKFIAVRIVAVKNGFAAPAAVTSAVTGVVLDVFVAPATVTAPSGVARYGETLSAPSAAFVPDPGAVTYQWGYKASSTANIFTPIDGETGATHAIGAADLNKFVAVRVSASRNGFAESMVTSALTSRVAALQFSASFTAPSVGGQAIFGRTLTATTGTRTPTPESYTFRWLRGEAVIPNATSSTYTLTVDDIGSIISAKSFAVKQGYEDLNGKLSTNTTATVVAATFAGTDPKIDGGAYLGQSLTVDVGTISPQPANITYQWLRGSDVVQTGTDPYELTDADIGKIISFRVTASTPGFTTRVGADATAVVRPKPTFTRVITPTISGSAGVGSKLTGARGTWVGTSPVSAYRYQWNANGVAIPGATGPSFVVQAAQRAKKITFTVTATLLYSETATSASSKATASVAYGSITAKTPKISGTTRAGKTLTAVPGSWSPSGLTFTYQWLRNGKAISGAKSRTYALTGSDYKKKISVIVKGAKAGYTSATKTSAKTKAIAVGTISAATPTITGSVAVGSKVTVKADWGPGSVSKKYQWYSGSKKISKATKSTFTIPSSLKGKKLSVKVTGKKTGFSSVSKKSSSKTVAKRP